MRTATAHSGRASERSAHKIAEKLARNAGVAFDDWIEAAIREYAEDLGVAPRDLNERERLEAIEERVDREASGAPARTRREAEYDEPSALRRAESPRRRRDANDYDSRAVRDTSRSRDDYDAEPDGLDEAVERIEKRAHRQTERPAASRESRGEAEAQRRLEQAVAEVEQRAERNAQRTARALQSLADLVEARGEDRGRLEQSIEEVQKRAERNERRTARALESLTGLIDARAGDREGLEAAIERIARRAEQSEARTARALESLSAPVAAERRPVAPPPAGDAVAARLDALSRRAARTPEPKAAGKTPSEDEETFRLVAERLARRRQQRQETATPSGTPAPAPPAAVPESSALVEMQRQLRLIAEKVDALPVASPPKPPHVEEKPNAKDAAIERVERQLAALVERVSAPAPVAKEVARGEIDRRASSLQSVERRLDELGARIEASARRATPDPKPLEDLARRVEAIRVSLERQGARPDGAALLAALAHLNDKLDSASAAGSQSAATMAALQGMIGRLEEGLRRQAPAPIDPRPIEDLARRIEGVRGLVEGAGALAPKVEQIHAAVGELSQKLDRPAAKTAEMERLEAALRQLSAEVQAMPRPGAPDMKPVEDLARRIEAMRMLVERQGGIAPKVDQIQAAVGELRQKIDRPAAPLAEIERVEAALRQLSADVQAMGRAPDMTPVEELGRRIEAMRKAMEANGAFSPQVERLERALAEIRTRLDRPTKSAEIEAVDATLRQLAAKFDEVVSRPATVALDPKPIEDLVRRIESVRESLEKPPTLAPQVERLETAIGAMADKLDRAQPIIDPHGINATLAEMNARLEEAFRRPAQFEIDPQPIEALAARVEAVRETIERQAEQLDIVGRPIDELGKRLDTLREAVERQAEQLDVGRIEEAFRDAVEKLERPGIGPEEFRAIVLAIQALASKIDGGASAAFAAREDVLARKDVLERIAERLDRFDGEAESLGALAAAIGELAAKVERPVVDMSRLEAIVAQAAARRDGQGELTVVAEALAELHAKLDGDGDTSQTERFYQDVVQRLDSIEAQMASGAPTSPPSGDNIAHLELAVRELAEKLGDFGAIADTRAVEQELRVLQEKMDDLADARMSDAFAERTAQAIAHEIGERLPTLTPEPIAGPLRELQDRLDAALSQRPAPAALENTMVELTEELEGLRAAREAIGRGAATLSEMRAAQLQVDRRLDARFSGIQDVLEKLVDRLDRDLGAGTATRAAALAPAGRVAMLDIPDRIAEETRAAAAPIVDPVAVAAQGRSRDGAESAKAAAINAHIAAARRAANAAASDNDPRAERGKTHKGAEKGSGDWAHRATTLFQQHRRPVLLGVAGALTLLTGAAVYEMRGHAPVRKSELEAPATPLAQAAPSDAAAADMAPTGAIAGAPKVVSAELPPVKAGPKPPDALIAALPAEVGSPLAAAAASGDAAAEVEIAQRYLEGRTVPRDPQKAAGWMQAAADAGNVFAQYRLGALYEKGVGVARDAGRARELYTKAAEAGNARAMHNLAVLYAQDGGAGKPDYAMAVEWFRRAATYGVRDSQFNLGVLYGRGLGAPQDLAQSWMWFSVGARQGDADAARKRDEVANRMDGRAMAAAQKLLDAFKPTTPDPAVNNPPPVPGAAAAASPADGKAAGVKG
jgi:localization factor PodJL